MKMKGVNRVLVAVMRGTKRVRVYREYFQGCAAAYNRDLANATALRLVKEKFGQFFPGCTFVVYH